MYEKGSGSQEGTTLDCDGLNGPNLTARPSGIQDDGSNSMFVRRPFLAATMAKHKICRCGKGYCKILTSKKVNSNGRMFYCCPQSTGADNHGCGMFEWVEMEGSPSSSNVIGNDVGARANNPIIDLPYTSSLYARGFLEGVIRGSEQQAKALKDVLAAMNKLDVNKK